MNNQTNIEFEQLTYGVKCGVFNTNKKIILNNINGEFRGFELSGIVGPSGSGKTTLLNILSGFARDFATGRIKINGETCDYNSFKKQATYIMQEENLHTNLTIREAMNFAVKFKTGNVLTKRQRKNKIVSVLTTLGLENKLSCYSGDLSGGERKRLSIALELVDDPAILFLDEPTTGLDSSSSTHCIQFLKKLAREGKTIICTIHTPSALLFEMFDHIYALANGNCIYQGSSQNLVPFLSELDLVCPEIYSPSDFLLEIATNDYGEQNHRLIKKIHNGLNHLYRCSENNNNSGISKDNTTIKADHKQSNDIRPYSSPFGSQFIQLLYRNFLFLTRDKMFFLIRLFVHLFVGLSIGALYYDIGHEASQIFNIYRFVAITVGFLAYSGFYSLMVRFPLDLPITKREHFNRWYSPSAYYLALLASDIPIILLCTTLYVSIIYTLTDQPMDTFRFLNVLFIAFCASFTAQAYGMLMGSMFEMKTGLMLAAVLMGLHCLFGGFFIVSRDIPEYLYWVFEITYLKHAIDGVGALIFGYNRPKLRCSESYSHSEIVYCHFQSTEKFMKFLGLSENLPKIYGIIFFTLAVLHITTYCVMRHRLKN